MSGRSPGAVICPECRKLINADERRCPYCNAPMPGLGGGVALTRIFGDRLDMVAIIPAAIVVIYLISLALDLRSALNFSGGIFGILGPSSRALGIMGMTGAYATHVRGDWWTLATAIYLHGGLLHIFFNLMWLRQLAPPVGEAFGPARFFVIFTVSGVVGFLLSDFLSGAPTIGASGSVMGLMAALIVYGRKIGGRAGEMITGQLWGWVVAIFALGFFLPGVNNWAHLGGFVGGGLAALMMAHRRQAHERRGVILLAFACLGVTLYGFGVVALRIVRVVAG